MSVKLLLAVTCLIVSFVGSGVICDHDQLVEKTNQACRRPEILATSTFTNEVALYRSTCTGTLERCAADLSTAISLIYRLENDQDMIGSREGYSLCETLLSNIIQQATTTLAENSWVRYGAAFERMMLLNNSDRTEDGFCLTTNMLAKINVSLPDVSVTNYWSGIMILEGCPGMSVKSAFNLNAALLLADQKRWTEVVAYTNQLSTLEIERFKDDVKE